MAEQTEHAFAINRRCLLAASSVATTAAAVPLMHPIEASAIQPAPSAPEVPARCSAPPMPSVFWKLLDEMKFAVKQARRCYP